MRSRKLYSVGFVSVLVVLASMAGVAFTTGPSADADISSASNADTGGVLAQQNGTNSTTTETETQTTTAAETTTGEATKTTTSTSAGGSASTAPVTEIDSCTQINQPGRYRLTTDIENTTTDQCIQIQARDVVFDGDGHTIDGVDDFPTSGVVVFGFSGATNVTVTNVTVTDWGAGIAYEASTGTIRDSVIDSNSYGIEFTFGAGGIVVTNNTLTENGPDIYLQSSSGNVFTNDTVSGNGEVYSSDSDPQEGPSVNNTVENLHLDSATVSFESKDVEVEAVESPPADPDGRTNIGQYVNASANSPDSFLDLDVNYEESDLGDVNESTLALWRYDGNWSEVSRSSVDTETNVVSANITDFGNGSVFAPLGETKTTETNAGNATAYYQIDFVGGQAIHRLRHPNYYTADELIRFAHGDTDTDVTRVSDGEFTTNHTLADRIESHNITVENGTATTTFTVADGESVTLTLASYQKVGPGWSPQTESQQQFVDSDTRTFESGTHTLTVKLPTKGNETE